MNFETNKSLLSYNTFHINAFARYFAIAKNVNELLEILDSDIAKTNPLFFIGGGSNILLTKNIDGLVVHNEIKGIEVMSENYESVQVKFQAGENWHRCVLWCVDQNFGGIENLSLIPGTIGAAPIQNIGAYGVELQDVFIELEALHIHTKEVIKFSKHACEFGYRTSIFKTSEKGKYMIISVTLQLSKNPIFNTSYGNIQQELNDMGIEVFNIKAISDAVIRIRQSKLPDPAIIGNAGSFFKNPIISESDFKILLTKYEDIPSYKSEDGIKVPAAWLIEHCHPEKAGSWKGYREHNYGVHEKQALCLVNYADANGADIFYLSTRIITSVQQTFNIALEREVNIW
jgi:UDP-N-acetylmuramate dehydrogenase